MSDAGSTPSKSDFSGLSAAALGVWMGVQLVALGISAFRVRLWAREPFAAEQLALGTMLITQIGLGSLIFPLLLRNFRSSAVAITTAWPLALLASFLADASVAQVGRGEAYVTVWLIGLFFLARAIRSERGRLLALGCVAMLTLGGPLLWYLGADFSSGTSPSTEAMAFLGPIGGALAQIFPDSHQQARWISPLCLIACGLACNLPKWQSRYAMKDSVK
jgi:hypothetical protein